uniref:TIL domain-containing protein n=1 Tax=Rhabditophanes sp. KR3021 TaxID=114890 RepID=A0AC35UCT6_9BILA
MKVQVIVLGVTLIGFLMARDISQGKCSGNKVWSSCGGCEAQCSDTEPMMCAAMCRPAGCYCPQPDFALDSRGNCVPKTDCGKSKRSIPDCPKNEVYMTCGPSCKNVCGRSYVWCPQVCDPAGCYCTGEYALDKEGGKCILRTDC